MNSKLTMYASNLAMQHFLDPINQLYGMKDGRPRCILCCEKCIKNVCVPVRADVKERIRHGRKTSKYCFACGVVIRKHCWPHHSVGDYGQLELALPHL